MMHQTERGTNADLTQGDAHAFIGLSYSRYNKITKRKERYQLRIGFFQGGGIADNTTLAMTGGANDIAMTMGLTGVSAIAYLFFNLFTPPCFAAIGAMNSEMRSKGWLWSAIGLQMCVGYTVAFLINQFGTLIAYGHMAAGFVPGAIAIIVMICVVVMISRKIRAHFDEQYRLHAAAEGSAA